MNVIFTDTKELEKRGRKFCRYADDCNIYVCSQKAGERVMLSIKKFLEKKLRLKINEAKSKVARAEECVFLGYSMSASVETEEAKLYPIAKFLIKLGVAPRNAWNTAKSGKGWWRLSSCPALRQAMNNAWFEKLGLVSLRKKKLMLTI